MNCLKVDIREYRRVHDPMRERERGEWLDAVILVWEVSSSIPETVISPLTGLSHRVKQ